VDVSSEIIVTVLACISTDDHSMVTTCVNSAVTSAVKSVVENVVNTS
jgi:hypothetical protein